MFALAHEIGDSEIGGLAVVKALPAEIEWVDVIVPRQEVDSGGVWFEPDGLAEAMEQFQARQEAGDYEDGCELRGSWHSHGKMGVFFSGDDKDVIAKYGEAGTPWLSSIIINHKGEIKARLDHWKLPDPIGPAYWEDVEVKILAHPSDNSAQMARDIVKDRVEKRKYTTTKYSKNGSTPTKGDSQKQQKPGGGTNVTTKQPVELPPPKGDSLGDSSVTLPEGDEEGVLKRFSPDELYSLGIDTDDVAWEIDKDGELIGWDLASNSCLLLATRLAEIDRFDQTVLADLEVLHDQIYERGNGGSLVWTASVKVLIEEHGLVDALAGLGC